MILQRIIVPLSLFLLALGDISIGTNGDTISARTYSGNGSYAKYPQWLASIEGLCEVCFKTSELDGALLYMDSSGVDGHYLYISMDDGKIRVDITVGEIASGDTARLQASFGADLNDNELHSLRVLHDNKQFEFTLDGNVMTPLQYDPRFTLETTSRVFIGGFPNTSEPIDQSNVRESPSFIGCVKDIQFLNDSSLTFQLRYKAPITEMGVIVGCLDPCEDDPCNGGECIPRWPTEDTAFCDCRSTLQAGPTCVEDSSDHQLVFTGTDYYCYSLPPDQPYTGEPQTAMAQLVPPIPSDGTIITGISTIARGSFAIYLKDHHLVVNVRYQNMSASITSENPLLESSTYHLTYLQLSDYAELRVSRELIGNMIILIENISLALPWEFELDFKEICVGGSVLEVVNYAGSLENVYFRHYALTEERNFDALGQTTTSRSDTIRFLDTPSDLSLVFTKYNFGGRRISFEIRPDLEVGGLFLQSYSEANHSEFGLIPFNGEILALITHAFAFSMSYCGEYNENEWNLIEIESVYGNTDKFIGLNITVNNVPACLISNATTMAPFATTPIEFGRTTGSSGFALADPKPFVGCIQNIVFERDSETFRPNLEELAREEQRFDTTGCFNCTDNEMVSCENGGSCALRGYRDVGCACPPGYEGDTCEVLNPKPTISDITTTTTTDTLMPTIIELHTTTYHTDQTSGDNVSVQPTPSTSIPTSTTAPMSTVCTHQCTPSPRTERDSKDIDAAEVGKWVGIAIGGLIGILLLVCVFILLYLIYQRTHSKERGFYTTGETGNKETLPHYSASLRRVSTHAVTAHEEQRNGNVVVTDQNRDKEFFI